MSRAGTSAGGAATIVGRNYATDFDGSIHDDGAARAHGYAGGLVPGVAIYAASLPHIVACIGSEWAGRGRVRLKFSTPCYEGDPLDVVRTDAEAEPGVARFECLRSDGRSSCSVWVGPDDEPPPDAERYPATQVRPQHPGSPEDHLLSLEDMGSVTFRPSVKEIDEYLSGVGAERDVFRGLDAVNPAFLLRTYTRISRANFASKIAGPTIHTESDVSHYRLVSPDEELSLRGKVRHLFAKRGHRYVTFDYVWFDRDGRPVLRDIHTVVYRLRSYRAGSQPSGAYA